MDIISWVEARKAKSTADLAIEKISVLPTGLDYKGSCTWAELQAITDQEVGDAWTVTDRDNNEYAWTEQDGWIVVSTSGGTAVEPIPLDKVREILEG